jgi:magnesium chelatase family protein
MPLMISELSNMKTKGEPSSSIRERVIKAREIQTERYKNIEDVYCNAQMRSTGHRESKAIQ